MAVDVKLVLTIELTLILECNRLNCFCVAHPVALNKLIQFLSNVLSCGFMLTYGKTLFSKSVWWCTFCIYFSHCLLTVKVRWKFLFCFHWFSEGIPFITFLFCRRLSSQMVCSQLTGSDGVWLFALLVIGVPGIIFCSVTITKVLKFDVHIKLQGGLHIPVQLLHFKTFWQERSSFWFLCMKYAICPTLNAMRYSHMLFRKFLNCIAAFLSSSINVFHCNFTI